MKPAPFVLHTPKTVEEALALLAETADDGGLILAGGQSLVPMMALRVAYPPHLIDINGIAGLDHVTQANGRIEIGATVRHAAFHRPLVGGPAGAMLARVCGHIAHYPIRMRGTFCGSLAHADPSSEWCLVATATNAVVTLASSGGQREVAIADYLDGAMTTTRAPDEMLLKVSLADLAADSRFGFYEFNRRAGDFALGMCLVTFAVRDGLMRDVRLAVGGLEEKARRLPEIEAALEGQPPDAARFEAASALVSDLIDPMDDPATPADYRRSIAPVVVRRALDAACSPNAVLAA